MNHGQKLITATLIVAAVARVNAGAVSGKLEVYGDQGLGPAGSVRVTLASGADTIGPAVSGSDGVFAIGDVPPGPYTLLVWAETRKSLQQVQFTLPQQATHNKGARFDVSQMLARKADPVARIVPRQFRISVGDEPVTSLDPILINRFRFREPEDETRQAAGAVVMASGTHSFPGRAPIWILPVLGDGKYLVQDLKVDVSADSGWTREGVRLEAGAVALAAVLVTSDGDNLLRQRVESGNQSPLADLPVGSRLLTTRRVTLGLEGLQQPPERLRDFKLKVKTKGR